MLKRIGKGISALALIVLSAGCLQNLALDQKVPLMTKEELRSKLGQPDMIIIDVRLEDDWKKSPVKIRGAVREDPEKNIKTWAGQFPKDKTLVFY
jgi:hypothetical protein